MTVACGRDIQDFLIRGAQRELQQIPRGEREEWEAVVKLLERASLVSLIFEEAPQ